MDTAAPADPTGTLGFASEFTFPIACGYPRWNSAHGGFGYIDPRDWTRNGVDLFAYGGTPVVVPVHGIVDEAGWGDIAGWKIAITDRFGYRHLMKHLDGPPTATTGMTVTAGQSVGAVGRTGNASGGGPHLHYEIRHDGDPIDPMPPLNATGRTNVEPAPPTLHTTTANHRASCDTKA